MIALGEIERRIRETGELSLFEETHLHRAFLEDALGRTRGRDRLRDRALAALAETGRMTVDVETENDAMLAFATAGGWRGHRWVMRGGDRIASEIEVIDGAARVIALGGDPDAAARAIGAAIPMHAPLGELRAGRGQLATAEVPDLPPGFPPQAHVAACWLHRFWNARALESAPARWRGPAEAGDDAAAFALKLLAALPDAVCLIERGTVIGDHVGLLWRLHGHHLGPGWGEADGRRVRLIGSSLLRLDGARVVEEDMLIDTLALRATAYRPLVDYAA